MKKIFFLFASIALAGTTTNCQTSTTLPDAESNTEIVAKAITVPVNEFHEQLSNAKDYQLLDVRTEGEFESGYIKGAMWADWMSREEFSRRIAALDKNKTTFVYCLSGGRSGQAVNYMKQNGFTNIIELKGGINAWNSAGMPLEADKDVPQISEETYKGMLASKSIVLVDFGAEWCAPCRKMEPTVQEIEKEFSEKMAVVKMDAGSQKELVRTHQVDQLPTFILYKNGTEIWRTSGLTEKSVLTEAIRKAGE